MDPQNLENSATDRDGPTANEHPPQDPALQEDLNKSPSAGTSQSIETMALPPTGHEDQQADSELGLDIRIGVVEPDTMRFEDPHKEEDATSTLHSSEEDSEEEIPTGSKGRSYFQADYYDGKENHQVSPLTRTILFCIIGLLLVIGGNVWAVLHSDHAATYSSVSTGQPVSAVVCSQADDSEECNLLPEREQPCRMAIEYNFTIPESGEGTTYYHGNDVFPFLSPNQHCHQHLDAVTETFLNSTNLVIYYDPENPDDNHYVEPPKPSSTSAIIVSVSCVLGLLFMLTGVLERML